MAFVRINPMNPDVASVAAANGSQPANWSASNTGQAQGSGSGLSSSGGVDFSNIAPATGTSSSGDALSIPVNDWYTGGGTANVRMAEQHANNPDLLNSPEYLAASPEQQAAMRARAGARGAYGGMNPPGTQVTVGEMLTRLSGMSEAEVKALQDKLYSAGYFGTTKKERIAWGVVNNDTVKAFQELLTDSSASGWAKDMTWDQFLDRRLKDAKESGLYDDLQGEAGGPSTATRTASQSLESGTAKMALQEFTGRGASDEEVARFTEIYNRLAAASPQVTTVTDDGQGNTTQTTTGGVNQEFALNQAARENPDYANYQAAATYFPVLRQLLAQGGERLAGELS